MLEKDLEVAEEVLRRVVEKARKLSEESSHRKVRALTRFLALVDALLPHIGQRVIVSVTDGVPKYSEELALPFKALRKLRGFSGREEPPTVKVFARERLLYFGGGKILRQRFFKRENNIWESQLEPVPVSALVSGYDFGSVITGIASALLSRVRMLTADAELSDRERKIIEEIEAMVGVAEGR